MRKIMIRMENPAERGSTMNINNFLGKIKAVKFIFTFSVCILLAACNQKSYDDDLILLEKEEVEKAADPIFEEREEKEEVAEVTDSVFEKGEETEEKEEAEENEKESGDTEPDALKEMELNGIKVYPAIIKVENYNTDFNIEYPNIDVKSSEMLEMFNEQIYNIVFQEDWGQYWPYTTWAEITYEITFFNEQFLGIHFTGYVSYIGSYTDFNKGLLFDLETAEIMRLNDFYTLPEIKKIIYDAWEKNEIRVIDLPVTEDDIKEIVGEFVKLFETEEYISRTDIFFITENHIYFLAPPPESMRQNVYIEMDIAKFPKILGK